MVEPIFLSILYQKSVISQLSLGKSQLIVGERIIRRLKDLKWLKDLKRLMT